MTDKTPLETNKDDCLICGAKKSITREIRTMGGVYYALCCCSTCSSDYAGIEDYRLTRQLNKVKDKVNEPK